MSRAGAEAVLVSRVHHVTQTGVALGFGVRSHYSGTDQPALILARWRLHDPLIEDSTKAVADALVQRARLAFITQPALVLSDAVSELVSNHVGRLPKVDKDVLVAIAMDHLLAVPERVLVIPAVIQAGRQVHAAVVDRVSPENGPVKVGDLPCSIEHGLKTDGASRWVGHRTARQRGSVSAIKDMLLCLVRRGFENSAGLTDQRGNAMPSRTVLSRMVSR